MAIINGELFKQGNVIEGHILEAITEDSVTLRDPDGNTKTIVIGDKALRGSISLGGQVL